MTKRIWLSAILAACTLAGACPVLRAQATSNPLPRKIYTKRTAFKLPLRVDPKDKPRLQQVELFVRNGPQGTWSMKESVPPTKSEFVYHAPADGEYWFAVVTVDRDGQKNPPDISQEPPGLIVVVDQQPPMVDVQPMNGGGGQSLLKCDIQDANPDPGKTRMEIQNADLAWYALESVPGQPTVFRVPSGGTHSTVRVTAVDLAGNSTTREINLPSASGSQVDSRLAPQLENRSESRSESRLESRSEKYSPPAFSETTAPSGRQFINTTHASLKYQVEQEGPSGIGRVEVWITRDDGQNWQKLCEDPNRRSPVDIDLPGEGVYGLSVVVTSGTGNGGVPPARGEAPDWHVEVDLTRPEGRLMGIRPASGMETGFVITWNASDKNLRPEPIELEYATRPDGPWLPITRALHNDGNYRWSGPAEPSGKFYVRMVVTDLAGNQAMCMAPEPLILDRSHPKGHVLGLVTGASSSVPLGN